MCTWQAKQPGFSQYTAFSSLSNPLDSPCVCVWQRCCREECRTGAWWGGEVKAPLEPDAESLSVSLLFKGANTHWLVQRQVVFVLLLAWGQNSGRRHSLLKTVTLNFRIDELWGGFSLFVQLLQQFDQKQAWTNTSFYSIYVLFFKYFVICVSQVLPD